MDEQLTYEETLSAVLTFLGAPVVVALGGARGDPAVVATLVGVLRTGSQDDGLASAWEKIYGEPLGEALFFQVGTDRHTGFSIQEREFVTAVRDGRRGLLIAVGAVRIHIDHDV